MQPGQILYTKDGSKTGNGIIRREFTPAEIKHMAPCLAGYLDRTNQRLFEVITDFGNIARFCTNEINEMYLFGPVDEFAMWHAARWDLITKLNEHIATDPERKLDAQSPQGK